MLAFSPHLPLPLHLHHRGHVRPVARQPLRAGDERRVPLLLPAVPGPDRPGAVRPDPGEVHPAGALERRLHGGPQRRLVALDRQQVVPALRG